MSDTTIIMHRGDIVGTSSPSALREHTAMAVESEAVLTVRPEDIVLDPAGTIAGENVLVGQVRDLIYLGNFFDCRIDVDGYELRVQLNHDEACRHGERVYLTFPSDACSYLPL